MLLKGLVLDDRQMFNRNDGSTHMERAVNIAKRTFAKGLLLLFVIQLELWLCAYIYPPIDFCFLRFGELRSVDQRSSRSSFFPFLLERII